MKRGHGNGHWQPCQEKTDTNYERLVFDERQSITSADMTMISLGALSLVKLSLSQFGSNTFMRPLFQFLTIYGWYQAFKF